LAYFSHLLRENGGRSSRSIDDLNFSGAAD